MDWKLDKKEKLTICGAILLAALGFLPGSRASAQETRSNDPPPIPLEQGEAAPYAGDLWSVNRSLRLIFRAEQCQQKAELELKHAVRKFEIELKYERDRADARADADTQRIQILAQALDEADPWWRSPAFVAALTSVVTLALVAVVAVVLEQVAAFAQIAGP